MKFFKCLKAFLAIGMILCVSFNTQAQGFYGKLSGGYNAGIGYQNGSDITVTNTMVYVPNSDYVWHVTKEEKRVKLNFGKGRTGNVALGYMFNKQLGAEMEVGYLAGEKNNTSMERIYNPDPDLSGSSSTEMHARMFLFQPSLVLATDLSEKLDLYGKFGIVAAKGTIYMERHSMAGRGRGMTETEYTGGWGFGLQGALGLAFSLSQRFELFSELKLSNLAYSPKVFYLKKQIENDRDVTEDPDREHPLEDSYTSANSPIDPALKESYTFSSAGLNVGLKYNF